MQPVCVHCRCARAAPCYWVEALHVVYYTSESEKKYDNHSKFREKKTCNKRKCPIMIFFKKSNIWKRKDILTW